MSQWCDVLSEEKDKPYFVHLIQRVNQLREQGVVVYPPQDDVFNAFNYTEFDQVKVVILGQDPYHGPGQAHGLCFSVQQGVKLPPSLKNIYKELAADIGGIQIPAHGNLSHWAEQGVLLLNMVLTVEQGKAHSHAKFGWETFTDTVIRQLSEQGEGIVFLLWGSHAQRKGSVIDQQRHHVLHAPHPSPLSAHRGFFGCRHFSRANALLLAQGKAPVNWQV